jgi:optic atrophy 3 protein
MRMRLGLLQDPAVIDRQIKKELQAAEAARQKAAAPTVKTEEEMKAEEAMTEKEKDAIRKKLEDRKPRIRPLSEQKAIETGANFVAETFIFAVGIGVIVFEQWRQRRKAKNARDDIREDLEDLQNELKTVKAELAEIKARHPEPGPTTGVLGFWKGKAKPEEKAEKATEKVASNNAKAAVTDHSTETTSTAANDAPALQPSSKDLSHR